MKTVIFAEVLSSRPSVPDTTSLISTKCDTEIDNSNCRIYFYASNITPTLHKQKKKNRTLSITSSFKILFMIQETVLIQIKKISETFSSDAVSTIINFKQLIRICSKLI
jgi:predicted adenine nucleotide alpha hydrolase (AANH) superfamily ATPase